MMRVMTSLLTLILLSACATEGKVVQLSGGQPIPRASVMSLAVTGCEKVVDCEEIRSAVAGRLIGANLAERIVAPGQPADLALAIQVTNTRTVSGAERVFFGAMAGRNTVASTDTVHSLRGGAPVLLRTFKVESGSAAHPFSGESGQSDAFRRFAADTVDALRS